MRPAFRVALLSLAIPVVLASSVDAKINVNTAFTADNSSGFVDPDIGWLYTLSSGFTLTGINTIFGPTLGADRDITIEIFQGGPPFSGGTLLASSVFNSSVARSALGGATFAPLVLGPGDYFLGFLNVRG